MSGSFKVTRPKSRTVTVTLLGGGGSLESSGRSVKTLMHCPSVLCWWQSNFRLGLCVSSINPEIRWEHLEQHQGCVEKKGLSLS